MLKNILFSLLDAVRSRTFILGAFFIFLMGILIFRIFNLQIINGENYLDTFTYRIQKDVEIESPRGTIYDCNGVPLAYNKLSYSVQIEDSTLLNDNQTKNTMIANLIKMIDKTGNTIIYDIPIDLDENGNLEFTEGVNTIIRFKKDIYSSETLTTEQENATPQQVYDYMRGSSLFNVSEDEGYDTEMTLRIISLRYDSWMKRYEKYLSVTVATDINNELVAAIKENADILPGVTIEQDYSRVYADSEYFSNITGYTGAISEEQLAEYEAEGNTEYSSGDKIGKTGIEAYYEDTLKGTKGSQTLYVNSLGSVLGTSDTVEAVAGNDVYLSIDSELQKKYYDMLEERIAGILLAYMTSEVDSVNKAQQIPIKDFYYALIDNNIISLDHLSADDADDREKSFYNTYKDYEASLFDSFDSYMDVQYSKLSDENQTYFSMAYSMLKDNDIVDVSLIADDDETISQWSSGKISFKDLLDYLISQGTIDISQLDLKNSYVSAEEIYDALVDYITEYLPDYNDFMKEAYYYMLQNNVIEGKDICLLLYSQGIFEEDDDYNDLVDGTINAYTFMYRKIDHMEITPAMLALKPCSGSLVIVDVNTGKVKALVSYPGYDANKINDVSYFSQLVNSQASPFYDRPLQQTTAPGSTFKMIAAIAGLESGTITTDTYIYDRTEYTKVEPYAYCWSSSSHGDINVEDAIKYSCNYFFYELGYRMGTTEDGTEMSNSKGLEILTKYAEMFGLNETTGIELTESDPQISTTDIVRSCIGQGTNNFTAAQLCRYVTAIANNGNLYKLTLTDKISSPDGTNVEEKEPELERTIELQSSTWDAIHTGMWKVCNESEYKEKMANRGVEIAGKSGTAQESENDPNHGLFVGYAPYDDPEISMALVIPNAYGSSKVLDLYADIMCDYFGVSEDTSSDSSEDEASDETDSGARYANIPEVSSQTTD